MGVIEFKKPEPEEKCDPHMTGDAICSACRHEWIAVAPVGSTVFECPSCYTMKGRMKYDCMPSGGLIWQCLACDGDLFRILGQGAMCVNCGKRQYF